MLLYFHEFCSVAKLNFAKALPCHLFLPTWIIHENIFHKIIEIAIFAKIYGSLVWPLARLLLFLKLTLPDYHWKQSNSAIFLMHIIITRAEMDIGFYYLNILLLIYMNILRIVNYSLLYISINQEQQILLVTQLARNYLCCFSVLLYWIRFLIKLPDRWDRLFLFFLLMPFYY